MSTSVELAHVYRAELEEEGGYSQWAARIGSDVRHVSWAVAPRFHLFVDDYPDCYDEDEREGIAHLLMGLAGHHGIDIDVVAFESSCAAAADALADALPHDAGWLTRNGDERHHAVLIERDGYYSCAALSAIWTLARLGVEPYQEAVLSEAVQETSKFAADTIVTVLPTKYMDTEAAVLDILRLLRTPRIPLSRVKYVFA